MLLLLLLLFPLGFWAPCVGLYAFVAVLLAADRAGQCSAVFARAEFIVVVSCVSPLACSASLHRLRLWLLLDGWMVVGFCLICCYYIGCDWILGKFFPEVAGGRCRDAHALDSGRGWWCWLDFYCFLGGANAMVPCLSAVGFLT